MSDRLLLVSDLDGTLVGDDSALRRFSEWHAANRQRVSLTYATGRLHDDVRALISATELPEPDAIISAVGTEIRLANPDRQLPDWPPVSEQTWDPGRVRLQLADDPRLTDQPQHVQTPYKVSYFAYDLSPDELQDISSKLASAGLKADIIYSSQRDLDVMPAGVNKGTAVARLAKTLGWKPNEVIVCGDTGNDLAMFTCGFRGIVVGNAHGELKALACDDIFLAGADCAGGVLEGVEHWLKKVKTKADQVR